MPVVLRDTDVGSWKAADWTLESLEAALLAHSDNFTNVKIGNAPLFFDPDKRVKLARTGGIDMHTPCV